jgi:acetyl-CoA carboxylase biotin carboxyl carrier protein
MGMAAASESGPGDVFDVRKVRRFIELMNEHDLAEIDLRQGDQRIRLRRGQEVVTMATAPHASPLAPGPAPSSPALAAAASTAAVAPAQTSNLLAINSPMVGTFYTAPNPDAAPYVKIGDHVGPETTVCIVEAMKVFNEIPAECSGKVVAILVKNGDAVEYGQPLFRVEPPT